MRRDTFLKSLTALAAASATGLPLTAWAQSALRMMIPANPGGGWDLTGRSLGQALQDAGQAQSVTFENRGGAAGTIGLAQFYNARRGDPDALLVMGAVMLGGIITGRPPVSITQITPIARLTTEFNVFVLPADSPLRTMRDVVEQLRRDPGSVKWGGGSRGATEHVAAALIARASGVDAARINYVPFRGGGEAVAAILGGNVTIGGSGLSEFLPHIQAGRMRAIGVTSEQRLPGHNIPTLREQGIDVVIGNWRGVFGAAGITPAQRAALTERVVRATQSQAWRKALQQNGWTPALLTGPAFDEFVERDFARLRAVMVMSGMI